MDLERLERLAGDGDTGALNAWLRAVVRGGDAVKRITDRKGRRLVGDLETARCLRGLGFECRGMSAVIDRPPQAADVGYWRLMPFIKVNTNIADCIAEMSPHFRTLLVFPDADIEVPGSWGAKQARLCACDCFEQTVSLWTELDDFTMADKEYLTTSAATIAGNLSAYRFPALLESARRYARGERTPDTLIYWSSRVQPILHITDGLRSDDNIQTHFPRYTHVGSLIKRIGHELSVYRYRHIDRLPSPSPEAEQKNHETARCRIEHAFTEIMLDYLTEVRT